MFRVYCCLASFSLLIILFYSPCSASVGILFTPVTKAGAPTSLNVSLRKDLDIYASLAVVKTMPGVEGRHGNVDIAVIRENTEGEYSGLEHQVLLCVAVYFIYMRLCCLDAVVPGCGGIT